jgi:8-oxo-dGTP pyrophosphatase MutT (NUDIX family)
VATERAGRPDEVEAAGGLVRRRAAGRDELVVVHRPRYDDWTFPKGKLHAGEDPAAAALREVGEETGIACRLEREAGFTRYRDAKGRPKRVRYWLMEPAGHSRASVPNSEVDEVRWVTPEAARRLLTYEHDRALVDGLAGRSEEPAPAAGDPTK